MGIRSTAKALVIDNGKILLNRCFDKYNGDYFCLPGGGQEMYETLPDTIRRELLEETGYNVNPLRFVGLCELINDDADFRVRRPEYSHKMYHIFLCSLNNAERKEPTEKDSIQIESCWIPLNELKDKKILPACVNDNIEAMIDSKNALFLGSFHLEHNNG